MMMQLLLFEQQDVEAARLLLSLFLLDVRAGVDVQAENLLLMSHVCA